MLQIGEIKEILVKNEERNSYLRELVCASVRIASSVCLCFTTTV